MNSQNKEQYCKMKLINFIRIKFVQCDKFPLDIYISNMVIIILYNQYKYYTKIIVQNTWKTLLD